jgi:hypothetical protein
MADLIAILALGLQCSLIIVAVNFWVSTTLSFVEAISFPILVIVGLVLWHRKEFSQTVKQWSSLAVRSVILGIGFFGVDFLVALSQGQPNPLHFPGGLLGLPLTLLVCPGGTIICLAGAVRALYISRRPVGTE